MAKKTKKTKQRKIQIINGEMRDIEDGEGDVTAVPPGSEFISQQTMNALITMLKRKLRGDEDSFDIEDTIITQRKLRDGREKRKRDAAANKSAHNKHKHGDDLRAGG